jgi:alpha-L-fucosidase
MLNKVACGGGNLLLNIGPTPDGSVPTEAVEPLRQVGRWLSENGAAVYGPKDRCWVRRPNGICDTSMQGNKLYLWNWIWPADGSMTVGGLLCKLKAARLVRDGAPIEFEQQAHRIVLKNLPSESPDPAAGIAVMELEFEDSILYHRASAYPQLHGGERIGA